MDIVNDSQFAFDLMQSYKRNLRIKKNFIMKKVSPYSSYTATQKILERIRNNEILFGPKLWINSGFVINLIKDNKKSSLELFDKYCKEKEISYLMALMGNYSILMFKKGANLLKYAKCIFPSFPAKKRIKDIELSEKGDFERDKYPNWNDIDWRVFEKMRDPTRSFGEVGGELNLSWTAVQTHFKKISKDCDIWLSFYPKGFKEYHKAILVFKTDYARDLVLELEKIDRSSFLFAFENRKILFFHYEDYTDLHLFENLKKEKK